MICLPMFVGGDLFHFLEKQTLEVVKFTNSFIGLFCRTFLTSQQSLFEHEVEGRLERKISWSGGGQMSSAGLRKGQMELVNLQDGIWLFSPFGRNRDLTVHEKGESVCILSS